MVASGRVAYLARRATDDGVRTGSISVDMARVRQRKRDVVNSFRNGSQKRLEKTANLELVFGDASFTGPKSLQVRLKDGNLRAVRAERIFINVGTRASRPQLDGLDRVPFLDSTSIMELDTVPEHLIVLGGGYVGLEFGQMFRRFGSQVTIVQRGPRLLSREDSDVADAVADILRQDGVSVFLETEVLRVEPGIRVLVRSTAGERSVVGSHLLVAVGRTPNTDMLDLQATGLQPDKQGFLPANDRLETAVPGIYALGDVKGGPAFTHISYDDYRIIKTNLIDGGARSVDDRPVPYTVYIDPQLGRIGLSEDAARAGGRAYHVAKMAMSHVARALEVDETRGFLKVIVDAQTQQILGAAILALEGGELMSMLEIAMLGKLSYEVLRDAIFAHPTLAECFNNLFTQVN